MEDFYKEFEKISNEKWLLQVEKELKKPLGLFKINSTLSYNPFVGFEDSLASPLTNTKSELGWTICQIIQANTPNEINKEALIALEGGASGLTISINALWEPKDFEFCFHEVLLNIIKIRLKISLNEDSRIATLRNLEAYLMKTSFKREDISFFLVQDTSNLKIYPSLDFLKYEISIYSDFSIVEKLTAILKQAEKVKFHDLPSADIVFAIVSQENFYLNIAQIKAIKWLWIKIQEAYCIDKPVPAIVHLTINSKNIDPNLQVVITTQQAISSSIGGADLIEIDALNYNLENYSRLFSDRLTRNIQNILELESFFNKTLDASKGSYFIDNLTKNMIKEVWNFFIKA